MTSIKSRAERILEASCCTQPGYNNHTFLEIIESELKAVQEEAIVCCWDPKSTCNIHKSNVQRIRKEALEEIRKEAGRHFNCMQNLEYNCANDINKAIDRALADGNCCEHGTKECDHVCHRLGSSYCDSCCSCEPDRQER